MRTIRSTTFLPFGLVAACCLLCHCSARSPGSLVPESDIRHSPAYSMLQSVLATNEQLDTIKGFGRVRLRQDNQLESFRAAWMGRQPNQFLLKVLTPTMQPYLSFACDGKRIYFLSHSDNKLHSRRANENSLKRIVHIDITLEDFLDLISGRLPVSQGARVRLEEPADSGPLLILDDKELEYIDTISLDVDRITVRGLERRRRNGRLLFSVSFEKRIENEGFWIPKSLTIQDDNGRMIHISVEQTWVNQELSDDQFVLKKAS